MYVMRGQRPKVLQKRAIAIAIFFATQDLERQLAAQRDGMEELAGRTHQLVEENDTASGSGDRLFVANGEAVRNDLVDRMSQGE